MTQKDYVLIADALHKVRKVMGLSKSWDEAVGAIADALENDNPKFKRAVFYDWCLLGKIGDTDTSSTGSMTKT